MSEVLARFSSLLPQAAVFLDFDGTLSRIVHVPDDARPVEGARRALARLNERAALVAVISGRSSSQLLEWLGGDVDLWGVHGAERVVDGAVVLSEIAAPHADLMARVKQQAQRGIEDIDDPGVILEDKGVVIALHFRAADDRVRAQEALDELAQELADLHGLHRAGGRLAYELRPPIELTKRTVVEHLIGEAPALRAAMFVGDDRVDLGGFDALDALAEQGVFTVRVAVNSDEAPQELLQRADLIVDGPDEVVAMLDRL